MNTDNGELYAFVMRDVTNTTRYFAFDAPDVREGEVDERFGVRKRVILASEIKYSFDLEYHRGIQGACTHNGKIYSVEGGCLGHIKTAALRIIDPMRREEIAYISFIDYGITEEPEGIAFDGDDCYYVAGRGDTYILEDMDIT